MNYPRPCDMSLRAIGASMPPYFDDLDKCLNVQALCLAEEAGEAVQAYRQWAGLARRSDLDDIDLLEELADVVIVAAHMATLLGADLDEAVERKLSKIAIRRRAAT